MSAVEPPSLPPRQQLRNPRAKEDEDVVYTVLPKWKTVFGLSVIVISIILVLSLPVKSSEAKAGVVIGATALLWITEAMPLMITALLPAILFSLGGVIKMKEISSEYFNDISMLMLATFFMAASVEESNLHRRIALKILSLLGRGEALLMLGAMLTTWKLSMFLSNTATCAMMLPIISAIIENLRKLENSNLRGNLVRDGMPTGSEFEMNGQINEDQEDQSDLETNSVKEASPEFEWFCKGLILCIPYGASIGGIATLTGTPPNFVFKGFFDRTYGKRADAPTLDYGTWMSFAYPISFLIVIFGWHVLVLMYARRSYFSIFTTIFKPLCCKNKVLPAHVIKDRKKWAYINNTIQLEYKKLGPFRFPEVVLLMEMGVLVLFWLLRSPSGFPGWADTHLEMMGGGKTHYLTDAWIVLLISLTLFLIPNENPFRGRVICRPPPGTKLVRSKRLLSHEVVMKKTPWDVLFILGGGYAIAYGCKESGLSAALGDSFSFLEGQNKVVIALVISILVAALTEVTSNTASTTLLMPVLSTMSQSIKLNPLFLMITGTISASLAFCLPSATGPNALVFSFKQITVVDMARTGVAMNLVSVLVVVLGVSSWTSSILGITSDFPEWANL